VSFDATAFDHTQGEDVELTGALHVVARLTGTADGGWTLRWNANVQHGTGIGQTSGHGYVLTGAQDATVAFPPGPPVRAASFEPTFRLFPPGPRVHPPSPIRFLVSVSFDEAGRVTNVDAHHAHTPPPTTD
jgi:hypothetical protein